MASKSRRCRAARGMCRGAVFVIVPALAGCTYSHNEFQHADRARRLMVLAGEEVSNISSAVERLKRQLNLADLQTKNLHSADARETLQAARETLESAPGLDMETHARIAGWVSISELSRSAGDTTTANHACDQAVVVLRSIAAESERCEFVRGIATEIRHLRGKEAAGALLREGGMWTAGIGDQSYRRTAMSAFASDLFLCDDYNGGQELLRRDADASWRADTLLQLAQNAVPDKAFGKDVQFGSFFRISS